MERYMVRGEGRVVQRSGGVGLYGHCVLEVEPLSRGAGFSFVSALTGGVIPKEFVPAIEAGVRDAIARGPLAGYPVVDVLVRLVDGSFHAVDSSTVAFRQAGALAFRDACRKAQMVLLEPVGTVAVTVPAEQAGAVIGDLNRRRAGITDSEAEQVGNGITVRARVPLAEMFGYATTLRSLTMGRGVFTLAPAGYEEVPTPVAQEVITRRAMVQ